MDYLYYVFIGIGVSLLSILLSLWRCYLARRQARVARGNTPPGFVHAVQTVPPNHGGVGPGRQEPGGRWDGVQMQQFYPASAPVASAPAGVGVDMDQPPPYEFSDPDLNREVEEARRPRRQEPIFVSLCDLVVDRGPY